MVKIVLKDHSFYMFSSKNGVKGDVSVGQLGPYIKNGQEKINKMNAIHVFGLNQNNNFLSNKKSENIQQNNYICSKQFMFIPLY